MSKRTPQLRHHRSSGRAVVTLTDKTTGMRRDFYLGEHGTPEAHAAYADLIRDWLARGRRLDLTPPEAETVSLIDKAQKPADLDSVARLVADYAKYIDTEKGVKPEQIREIKRAIRYARIALHSPPGEQPLVCGALSVAEFGPKALQSVRKAMIDARKANGKPWTRKTINERMKYVVKMFRWAVSEERAPVHLPAALECVEPLRRGQFGVPDGTKRTAVPLAHVKAIKDHVNPIVWAMVQVQMRMVARAGEVCAMRPIDIDTTGEIWIYKPTSHKTEHHGHALEKFISPECQEYIKPLLAGRAVDAYLFDPREAYALQRAQDAEVRRRENQTDTPRKSGRKIGERYTTGSYGRAIERACRAAKVPKWTTHQLRHRGYSEAKKQIGVEKALLLLGDKSARMDEVYGEKSREMGIEGAGVLKIKGAA